MLIAAGNRKTMVHLVMILFYMLAVSAFWAMSLVGIYPGRAYNMATHYYGHFILAQTKSHVKRNPMTVADSDYENQIYWPYPPLGGRN